MLLTCWYSLDRMTVYVGEQIVGLCEEYVRYGNTYLNCILTNLHVDVGLRNCNTAWTCRWIKTLVRNILPSSSHEAVLT